MPRPRNSAFWLFIVLLVVAAYLPAASNDEIVLVPPVPAAAAAADSRLVSSIKNRMRTVLMCAVLEVGALAGVPMRPEQIVELMNAFSQPKVAHVLPSENDGGDDPPDGATGV